MDPYGMFHSVGSLWGQCSLDTGIDNVGTWQVVYCKIGPVWDWNWVKSTGSSELGALRQRFGCL